MAIKGITFNNQKVTATNHGAIFSAILGDGVINGCQLNYSGANLTISSGHIVMAGRLIQIVGGHTVPITATDGYARVIFSMNLNATATEDTFEQVKVTVHYASVLTGFPALVKESVNETGMLYDFEVCKLAISNGNISEISSRYSVAGLQTINGIFSVGPENYGTTLPTSGTVGRVFFKKV